MSNGDITKEQKKVINSIRESKGIKKAISEIEEIQKRKLTRFEKEMYFLGFLEGSAYISKKVSERLGK